MVRERDPIQRQECTLGIWKSKFREANVWKWTGKMAAALLKSPMILAFIHLAFIHSCILSFLHSFTSIFIHSCIHSLLHSFICIHSFLQSFILHPFTSAFIQPAFSPECVPGSVSFFSRTLDSESQPLSGGVQGTLCVVDAVRAPGRPRGRWQ